jgi:flagella basal body P-ring formation protein FlgA
MAVTKMNRQRVAVTLLTLGLSLGAHATVQPLNEINRLVKATLEDRALASGHRETSVKLQPLDSRLRLHKCEKKLEVLPSPGSKMLGHQSVGVRCSSPESWTVYVRADVTTYEEVPVLSRPVNRQDIIGHADIALRKINIRSDITGLLTDVNEIVGKEAKRNLSVGQPLRKSDIKLPIIVQRGQIVSLVSGVAGLEVRMSGKALADAASGELILVQNLSSHKRVQGKVLPSAEVLVK